MHVGHVSNPMQKSHNQNKSLKTTNFEEFLLANISTLAYTIQAIHRVDLCLDTVLE